MITRIIEATNGEPEQGIFRNWGKFLLGRMTHEWRRDSIPCPAPALPQPRLGTLSYQPSLLSLAGWTPQHLWVCDLQTGEGALFRPGGLASADLSKHKIWVCPLFEPFLEWLYQQDLSDLQALPGHIHLPDAEFQMTGYRRPGPEAAVAPES